VPLGLTDNLNSIAPVTWARKYSWDIKFDGAPAPFSEWFPASDIDEPKTVLEAHTFDAFLKTYSFPKSQGEKRLTITFYDDENNAIVNWLQEWAEIEMFNDDAFVATLEEVLKQVHIKKLNSRREEVQINSYWVYPDGTLTDSRGSDSSAQQYSMDFVVVGRVP
jgi:hypothetical protein